MGLWLARIIAIALFILLILTNGPNYTTVLTLPTAPMSEGDEAYVAVGGPGRDAIMSCPLGIEYLTGDNLGIIDLETERLVFADAAHRTVEGAFRFAVAGNWIYKAVVYDERTARLWLLVNDTTGRVQNLLPLSGQPARLGAPRLVESPVDVGARELAPVYRRLLAYGFSPIVDGGIFGGTPETLTPQSDPYRPGSWTNVASSKNGEEHTLSYEILGGKALRITLRAPDQTERNFEIKDPYHFITTHAVKALDNGDVFFEALAQREGTAKIRLHHMIVKLPKGGDKPVIYDLPLRTNDCVPRQDFAISDSGDVYFLNVRDARVSVFRVSKRKAFWGVRSFFEDLPLPFEFETPAALARIQGILGAILAPRANAAYTEKIVARFNPIERKFVLRNACVYVNESFELKQAHLSPDLSGTGPGGMCKPVNPSGGDCKCAGGAKPPWQVSRNIKAKMASGAIAVGSRINIPYNWGGRDNLAQFRLKVGQGRPAGQGCTKDLNRPDDRGATIVGDASDPSETFPSGLDCSGFVSRALGWPAPYKLDTSAFAKETATVKLARDVCRQTSDTDCLKPADMFVRSGDHIRLFFGWAAPPVGLANRADPTDTVWIAESAAGTGVKRHTMTLKELETGANGVAKPYERRRMKTRVIDGSIEPTSGKPWTSDDLKCVLP